MSRRTATVKRETNETSISIEFDIDGKGDFEITTGIRMFDHLLTQLARHGALNIKIAATGADPHHLVEDVGICLGRAFNQALGEKRGIVSFVDKNMADLPSNLVGHFLESFASEARLNLHVKIIRGTDDHHKAEATFKALARALDAATCFDSRITGRVPSTKDIID
jgi:imidazoleglycerol-phosphate dehydratase